VEDLDWYRGAIQDSVDDPAKDRFYDSNVKHLAEIDAEIARRGQS
jgi:hypothetical protein